MNMESTIEHEGVVLSDDGVTLRVSLLVSSACSSCQASRLCQASESREKVVEARRSPGCRAGVGQPVVVVGSARLGMKAVALAYAVPALILVAGVVAGKTLLDSDAAGGLLALAALVPWYTALYLARRRLGRQFSFLARDPNSI